MIKLDFFEAFRTYWPRWGVNVGSFIHGQSNNSNNRRNIRTRLDVHPFHSNDRAQKMKNYILTGEPHGSDLNIKNDENIVIKACIKKRAIGKRDIWSGTDRWCWNWKFTFHITEYRHIETKKNIRKNNE